MSDVNRIAFLFPGQGAQYIGMGKELYDNFLECREIFDRASIALGFDMAKLCFEGPEEKLKQTEYTQPAILTTSIATFNLLKSKGIKPEIMAGLSLGEYSCLVCSDMMTFEEAVKLVKKRGRFMQEAVPQGIGGMVALIGAKYARVNDLCKEVSKKGKIEPANYNCPGQVVLAGEMEALKYVCEIAKEYGVSKAIMLKVSGPFHSSMLKGAAERLEEELKFVDIKKGSIDIITNVTGEYLDKNNIKENLKKQIVTSVKWEQSINRMIEEGINTFVEVGPGKVLSGFVRKINRKSKVYNVEDIKSFEKTLNSLL